MKPPHAKAEVVTLVGQAALVELARKLDLADAADAAVEAAAHMLSENLGSSCQRSRGEAQPLVNPEGWLATERARHSGQVASYCGGARSFVLLVPIRATNGPLELLLLQRDADFSALDRSTAELVATLLGAALRRLAALTAFHECRSQLEQSERVKCVGQLAAGAAHDFNNLLMVISAAAEVLSHELGAEHPSSAHADLILQTSHRAAQLTRKLLALSRKVRPAMAPTNIHDVLEGVRELLVHGIERRITLQLSRCEGFCVVEADATQLGNAILNICLNARDAMPEGGLLQLTTERVQLDAAECVAMYPECQPGPHVQLEIRDTGSGMDEQTLARVFEPFFTTKEPGRGTGLGLPMALAVIREHRGAVRIRSSRGGGTTCTLLLPLVDPVWSRAPASTPRARRAPALQVLLVDDEPDVCSTSAQLVRKLGHNVIALCSGEKALSHLRVHASGYDLLILDVVMPGPTGLEIRHALARDGIELPTVFMSGSDSPKAQDGPDAVDGVVFIQKPFRQAELERAIECAVESWGRASRGRLVG